MLLQNRHTSGRSNLNRASVAEEQQHRVLPKLSSHTSGLRENPSNKSRNVYL